MRRQVSIGFVFGIWHSGEDRYRGREIISEYEAPAEYRRNIFCDRFLVRPQLVLAGKIMKLIHLGKNEKEYLKKIFPNFATDSFSDVLELLSRVHNSALHDGNTSVMTRSCFDIIEHIKEYKTLRCVEYSYLLAQVLLAYSIPARVIGLKKKTVETAECDAGHVVVEFWSYQFNKWIMLDPQYAVYLIHNDTPLSCVEIVNIGINNTKVIKAKNSRLIENDIEKYKAWLGEYLYYIDTAVTPDQNTTNDQRIYELKYMIVPEGAMVPTIFQRIYPLSVQAVDTDVFYQKPDYLLKPQMNYPDSFFQLQLDYAERVSELGTIPLEEALLHHTGFYKLIGTSDWDFDAENPQWQEFISQMNSTPNIDTIKKFCIYGRRENPDNDKKFGCFSYDFNKKTNNIHVHFIPSTERGSLSSNQKDQRLCELKQMFLSIREHYPQAKRVIGFSWLHNIPSYQRLFPNEYFKNMSISKNWYKSLAIWGQFINSDLTLKEKDVMKFLNCIKNKDQLSELHECFPFHVGEPAADIQYFYDFYKI